MVNTMDYFHLAAALDVTIKQEPEELEEKLQPPKKRRRIVKTEISEEYSGILKYSCEICNEPFKKKDSLDRHMFSHTGKKAFSCDTDGCTKQYTTISHLKRHKKTCNVVKLEESSVTCKHSNCNQIFTNRDNMIRHYQTHHVNRHPHSCTQCDDKFRRKLQLKKHIILKHSGEYPHWCQQCGKGFINTFLYTRHLTTHKVNSKERSCPECELTFAKWSLLVEHRRRMHKNEPRFTCDICSKTFCRKPNIKDHMKLHILSSVEVFQCHYDNCPKFYNAKRNLMSHIRSKHEGKRWICALCNEEKSTKQKLEQHIRAHLNPEGSKRLNKKQTHTTSTKARLIGVKLPGHIQEKLLNDEASEIAIDPFLALESTHETETSAAELSDF